MTAWKANSSIQAKDIKKQYDIVIVGGGMVGASFACTLDSLLQKQAMGRKIAILVVEAIQPAVNKKSAQTNAESFDARTTALSYGSKEIYQRMGLWPLLLNHVTPIEEIHISDRGHFGSARINSHQQQVEALGYVIENQHLAVVLGNALQDAQQIDFLCPATIAGVKPVKEGMQLELKVADKTVTIQSSLVVLADGGKSPICSQLGIENKIQSYQQSAIITNIAFEKPHDNIAYERFTDTGPLAILPLQTQAGENRGGLIWTIPKNQVEQILNLTESEFMELLQQRFGFRLGKIKRIGSRFSYPLALVLSKEQIRPGLVLLGNVAHTLHPVAGQGLNLALRDAEALASCIVSAKEENKSLGSMQVLQKFVRQQQADQNKTITFSHYLTRIFSNNKAALVWARKFGLLSIDLIPVLKKGLTLHAMGMADG